MSRNNEYYKNLAEELTHYGLSNGSALGWHSGLMDEAADAILALLAQVEQQQTVVIPEFVTISNEFPVTNEREFLRMFDNMLPEATLFERIGENGEKLFSFEMCGRLDSLNEFFRVLKKFLPIGTEVLVREVAYHAEQTNAYHFTVF